MPIKEEKYYVGIIVGAGISGLIAARKLNEAGIKCLFLDKGRNVGGRLATHYIGNLKFDHGAQIISAKSREFISLLNDWNNSGILKFTDYQKHQEYVNHHTEYCYAKKGMVELPRFLANKLNVKTSSRVVQLYRSDNRWSIKTSDNEIFSTSFIILTQPVPQSLELIELSDIGLPGEIYEGLAGVKYERCIALLIKGYVTDKYTDAAFIEPEEGPISLIVNNHIKGVSIHSGALTVHTNPDISIKNWNLPDAELIDLILKESSQYLYGTYDFLKIHRWRYSKAISSHPQPYLIINKPGLLAFAGDSFAGEDIEGAALSGLGAAEEIISILDRDN
jgi:predicted NAD/FAD-dependent oxidoreductase